MRYSLIIPAALMATVTFIFPQFAFAQRRGEVVEGLLRGFLEAQLEKERRKALQRQRYPEAPPPPTDESIRGIVPGYRTKLGEFARQSAALSVALRQSEGRVHGVRPLMADVLTLKTRAAVMYEQSRRTDDLSLLRQQYRDLDSQWRGLSYRLVQLRGLDAATLGHVRQLNAYCSDLCRLFELQPQFGREAVFRLTVETTTHLGTLLEDIQLELQQSEEVSSLVRECRALTEQCRRLEALVGESTHDDLITKYSTFVSDWRRFAVKLYPRNNVYCDRGIRRIHSSNQQVFQQLWTPLAIDRDYLGYVARSLEEEVNALFDNMTVRTLVQMPPTDQQSVLRLARDLYGQCVQYCQCVENNSPLSELMSRYSQIDRQWLALDRALSAVDTNQVSTSRRMITAYGTELRGLLGVPAGLNREQAIQLAASLEEMAAHLRYDTRRYGRYYTNAAFRSQSYQHSDAFHDRATNLHARLQRGASLDELQSDCSDVVKTWESLSATISDMPNNGLSRNRYEYLNESRQELLPVIAQLATLLGA